MASTNDPSQGQAKTCTSNLVTPDTEKDNVNEHCQEGNDPFVDFFKQKSAIYRDLSKERKDGWKNEQLERRHQKLRTITSKKHDEEESQKALASNMCKVMCSVFADVDLQISAHVPGWLDKVTSFLDVCCAPGGFSSYILRRNKHAVGVGLSPPGRRGSFMSVPGPDPTRFEMWWLDVTKNHPLKIEEEGVKDDRWGRETGSKFPNFNANSFGLVICDGHNVRNPYVAVYCMSEQQREKAGITPLANTDPKLQGLAENNNNKNNNNGNNIDFKNKNAGGDGEDGHFRESMPLIAASLHIALANLREGGVLVMRDHAKGGSKQVGLLCSVAAMFRGPILPCKPRTAHTERSSYYVTFHGFLGNHVIKDYPIIRQLDRICGARNLNEREGEEGGGGNDDLLWRLHTIGKRGRLDYDVIVKDYGPALLRYFEPLWARQTGVLKTLLSGLGPGGTAGKSRRGGSSNFEGEQKKEVKETGGRFGGGVSRGGKKKRWCTYYLEGMVVGRRYACHAGRDCPNAHAVSELCPEMREGFSMTYQPLVLPGFHNDITTKTRGGL